MRLVQAQTLCRLLIALAFIALLNQIASIGQVECYSKKFLSGLLIAYLMGEFDGVPSVLFASMTPRKS
jgi:hypothetical protein